MVTIPDNLQKQLQRYEQPHVLRWWDRLSEAEHRDLLAQLQALDLEQLHKLYAQRDRSFAVPSPGQIVPVPVVSLDANSQRERQCGEAALHNGAVAVLVVAGGQGSRLGFAHAKGMFPIGPVTNKSLFQMHAEKVLALTRRYGQPVPFLVMTSQDTDDETQTFFKEHRFFGLPVEEVFFICQGTMPALDMATGELLLETPGRLCTSPNGHGGALAALAGSGMLDRLRVARSPAHLLFSGG